jgi:hypothetical protein
MKLSISISQVISFILCLSGTQVMGQTEEVTGENTTFNKHRLTILMENAFIPAADNIADQNRFFIVPVWGFNYDYWINPKIGFGLHNSIILQQYKIEKSNEDIIIERSFPLIITGEFLVKPVKHFTVSVGAGRELEKHESFTVVNIGIEYGVELPQGWELSINLLYDNKIDAYDSWMLGVGFSKMFSCNTRKE